MQCACVSVQLVSSVYTIRLTFSTLCPSSQNADLLARAVITILTRRKEGGIWERGIRGGLDVNEPKKTVCARKITPVLLCSLCVCSIQGALSQCFIVMQ